MPSRMMVFFKKEERKSLSSGESNDKTPLLLSINLQRRGDDEGEEGGEGGGAGGEEPEDFRVLFTVEGGDFWERKRGFRFLRCIMLP